MNVLICGIVRNCGNKLISNLKHAEETAKLFNKSKIVIYENNSTDNTKMILNGYKNNNNFIIKSEDLNITKENSKVWTYTEITGSNHSCRIELIANARNKILEEINKSEYDDYEYIIWIDLDSNGWSLDGIKDSFNRKEEWDVLFGNSLPYYDYYALRSEFYLFGPECTGEIFWRSLPSYNFKINSLIPVYSAFNGIGIYKKSLLKDLRYDCLVNEEIKQLYRRIIRSKNLEKSLLETIKNADKKFPNGYKDEELDIFWKANSGYNLPIVCEHLSVNFALYNKGYKLFINPNMIYNR